MIIDVLWWCKTWLLSGYNLIHVKRKLLRKHKRACRSSWSRPGSLKSFTLTIPWNLARLVKNQLESLYVNTAQIGNECNCWKSSTQNQGRDLCSIVAIRSGWKMVSGFHGILLLSAKRSRSFVWWEDTIWKVVRNAIQRTSYSVSSNGRISPYFCERPLETTSIWSKSLARYISRLCIVRGENLERRHNGRRHWRIGRVGRIWTPRPKAQRKGSVNANERWQFHFPSRRWNSQNFYRRSGSENIHLDLGQERNKIIFEENQAGLLQPHDKAYHGMMVKPKVIFGLSQEILFTVITWNTESNCTCRLKNHSLFHWKTLTLPERAIQLWMWCRRNVLTITGTLMATDNCRMHGQVPRDSLCWMRNQLMDNMVWRDTDEETHDIKTRQCVARNVETHVRCIQT